MSQPFLCCPYCGDTDIRTVSVAKKPAFVKVYYAKCWTCGARAPINNWNIRIKPGESQEYCVKPPELDA